MTEQRPTATDRLTLALEHLRRARNELHEAATAEYSIYGKRAINEIDDVLVDAQRSLKLLT